MLDFSAYVARKMTLDELAAGQSVIDLHNLTNEMVDTMLQIIEDAVDADVIFEPSDPEAYDMWAAVPEDVKISWTLGHVIVHTSASAEEAAAQSSIMARGLPVRVRSRYEVPWKEVTAASQLRQRLKESRRMRLAFLETWPDHPHLEVTYSYGRPGMPEFNCVTRFLSGLAHDFEHLDQLRQIMRQSRAARGVS